MIELADAICKLLNDSNAKIQLLSLDNFRKVLQPMHLFIEVHLQLFYKALLNNLGSSNLGVRKNSDQILHLILDSLPPERLGSLLSPLVTLITQSNNARLKHALIDKLCELLTDMTRVGESSSTTTQ